MQVEVGQQRDLVFAGACLVLVLIVAGHIWIDELLAWVQWFISAILAPRIGLDQLF